MERLSDSNPEKDRFHSLNTEQKILERASSFRVPEGKMATEALETFNRRIWNAGEDQRIEKSTKFRIGYLITSAAAGLLILIATWFFLKQYGQTILVAEKGSHEEYTLPDGSGIMLNAGSKATFSSGKFNRERRINLSGEAFFNVLKGNPFVVVTSRGSVNVLGTSFNVYVRENSLRVSCLSGKVHVNSGGKSVAISQGETAVSEGNGLISFSDDQIDKTTGWMKGEFYYENSSLNLVLKEIERQFNVNFEARNFNDKFFTGSFTNRDLAETLDIICLPMGLKYEIGRKGKIFIAEK